MGLTLRVKAKNDATLATKQESVNEAASSAPPRSPMSPEMPDSFVFRDLDRYPRIQQQQQTTATTTTTTISSSASSAPSNTTRPLPGPLQSAPRPQFPRRQSSVRTASSFHFTAQPRSGSDSSTADSFHTSVTSTASDRSDSVASSSRSPSVPNSTSSSASSTDAIPLEAVQVHLAAASRESTPRAIRISTVSSVSPRSSPPAATALTVSPSYSSSSPSPSSPTSSRSMSYNTAGSLPTSPAAYESTTLSSGTAAVDAGRLDFSDDTYVDDDDDAFDETGSSPGKSPTTVKKLDAFFGRTQSHIKKIHMPSSIKQASADTLSAVKSMSSPSAGNVHRSMAQYNYDLVETLQSELRLVSVELAASIKRELDLESLLDQYVTVNDDNDADDDNQVAELSDGSSSLADDDNYDDPDPAKDKFRRGLQFSPEKMQELEAKLRKERREKVQMRLEFQKTVEIEREGRREAEGRRKKLEEQLKSKSKTGKKDALITANIEANETIKSLELALEDSQRKLYNERMNSQNLEYMLTGMREELQEVSIRSPSELSMAARASSSMQMLQNGSHARSISESSARSFASSKGSSAAINAMTDPEEMRMRIKDLETQKSALQDALRSLKDRHEIELKRHAEKEATLQKHLVRSRELVKTAVSARKVTGEKDVLMLREQVAVMKSKLVGAQAGKDELQRNLLELKQQFESITQAHEASQSRQLSQSEQMSGQLATIQAQRDHYKALLEKLERDRQQMKEEHQRMTDTLHSNSQRISEFSSQIQKLVADNHAFSSTPYLGVSLFDQMKVGSTA
ncbi:hypothetical protein BZA70DRAFT_293254 [Myxozyma melibiosi]|uniref:Up-regulated during septation protein 1 domain-containing protein n=1 Tax=Myxozyma melibiosi TaxID=54550 RepID=A0ABR1FDL7_9ASCO